MGHVIMTKTFREIGEIMKLPDGYRIVAADCVLRNGCIDFIVESEKIEEDEENRGSLMGGPLPCVDVAYREERLGAGIDFTRVTPLIFIDGKEIQ